MDSMETRIVQNVLVWEWLFLAPHVAKVDFVINLCGIFLQVCRIKHNVQLMRLYA